MDFTWTPEQDAYRMDVRRWLEENRPQALARGEDPDAGGDDAAWQRLKEWHKKLYHAGWAGLTWPKEYGGRGATFIEQVIFQQELGRLNLPMGCNVLGVIMTGPALMQWGTDEQKKRYLSRFSPATKSGARECRSRARARTSPSIQMPRRCSRATISSSTARRCGPRSRIARDFCQLFVRTDPDVPKHKGMSALLVDMKAPGVSVRPLRQITGDSRVQRNLFRGRARAQGKSARPAQHGMAGAGLDADA